MHVGGCVAFFRNGRCRYLQNTVDAKRHVRSFTRSPSTVNPGTHNTIDAQRHVGALPYGSFNGAHNTVEVNVGVYNTVCVRTVVEYYFCRCAEYGPRY